MTGKNPTSWLLTSYVHAVQLGEKKNAGREDQYTPLENPSPEGISSLLAEITLNSLVAGKYQSLNPPIVLVAVKLPAGWVALAKLS